MRDSHAPLVGTMESFLVHRHDLSPATMANYRIAITAFASWCERVLGRPAEIGDVEPGTVEQYLSERKTTVSAQTARSAWVALRSVARFLAEQRIHHDAGQSMLRLVRMPKVKDESRRALTDDEMWHLIERSAESESGKRDSAIVWTLLGCVLRREELAGLRLGVIDLSVGGLQV
jgi:site-specific recombinase XerD